MGEYCFQEVNAQGAADKKKRQPGVRKNKKREERHAGPCLGVRLGIKRREDWLFSRFLDAAEKTHTAPKLLVSQTLCLAMESIIPEKRAKTRAPCLLIVPTVFVNQLSWRIWIADERPGNRENTRLQKQTRVQKCRCLQQQRPRLCFWAPFSPSWPRALRCPWLMLQVVPFLVMTGAGVCHGYSRARGEIRRPCEDHRRLTHVATPRPPIKNESVGIEDDQIPS